MPIEFSCHQCSATLRVPEEHAGKKARCPGCSSVLDVPASDIDLALTTAGKSEQTHSDLEATVGPVVERWCMKTPDGSIYGPVSKTELDQWLADGRISAQCQLQRDGETTWQVAGLVYPQLGTVPDAAAPTGSAQYYQPAPGHSGGAAHAGPYPQRPRGNYRAHNGIVILLLGIFGFTFTCPILSVVAWVMGTSELKGIRAGTVDPEGKGLATAGMVMGIVGTAIFALGILIYVMMFGLMFAFA